MASPLVRRLFKLEIAKLIRLLERDIFSKLNSFNELYKTKDDLWKEVRSRVKVQYPDSKWTYNNQMREWESHPIQQYIKAIELSWPLPDLPPEIEKLTLDEIREYLIWKGENHQGLKEWKRYGRPKREDPRKDNNEKQAPTPKGNRAYVPRGKTEGASPIQIEGLKKGKQEGSP